MCVSCVCPSSPPHDPARTVGLNSRTLSTPVHDPSPPFPHPYPQAIARPTLGKNYPLKSAGSYQKFLQEPPPKIHWTYFGKNPFLVGAPFRRGGSEKTPEYDLGLSEDFSLLVAFLLVTFSWLFRDFSVAFPWLFRGPLLSRKKQCLGLFRGFFVAFSWPPFWAKFTRTRPGTVFWVLKHTSRVRAPGALTGFSGKTSENNSKRMFHVNKYFEGGDTEGLYYMIARCATKPRSQGTHEQTILHSLNLRREREMVEANCTAAHTARVASRLAFNVSCMPSFFSQTGTYPLHKQEKKQKSSRTAAAWNKGFESCNCIIKRIPEKHMTSATAWRNSNIRAENCNCIS